MQHLQPNTTLQGGKYRIERVLGQGGFGITYLATLVSSNRQVAIKELFIGGSGQAINDRRGNQVVVTNSANQQSFNQQKAKFKKEALRLANLNHPNLVKVHEFFEENGTAYYVMDYIEGESLRTKLNREGRLAESLVLKYMRQILPALEVAHKKNIWHLDIKPENIMIDRYGHTYLIDFGASKHIDKNSTLTTSLALAYTPGFCPPELTDLTIGDIKETMKEIGPWTDIYSLGATMYNLLTDNIPPSSNRLYRDGHNAFMFTNGISSAVQDMIVWMMKPNREERPHKVDDVVRRISPKTDRNSDSTFIENSNKEKKISEENIKGEAYKLRDELIRQSHQIGYLIWAFLVILSVILNSTLFQTRNNYPEDDVGEFFLDIVRGAVIGILIGWALYDYAFDWPKREQQKIKQWKEENSNDPRCKYL